MQPVVKNLLIINLIMFVATLVMGEGLIKTLGLYYYGSPFFQPYQIISHMFMHGGMTHILFNMFALWMFGSPLERAWGPKRFFIFYLVTGLGAAILHSVVLGVEGAQLKQAMTAAGVNIDTVVRATGASLSEANAVFNRVVSETGISFGTLEKFYWLNRIPTVGASGAVFGLLLGFGMLFPNTPLMLIFFPIPIKAKYFVILYGVMELVLGVSRISGDNIAHFAHLGGMVFGFILIKIWQKNRNFFY